MIARHPRHPQSWDQFRRAALRPIPGEHPRGDRPDSVRLTIQRQRLTHYRFLGQKMGHHFQTWLWIARRVVRTECLECGSPLVVDFSYLTDHELTVRTAVDQPCLE